LGEDFLETDSFDFLKRSANGLPPHLPKKKGGYVAPVFCFGKRVFEGVWFLEERFA
jgi:hypothetical protein